MKIMKNRVGDYCLICNKLINQGEVCLYLSTKYGYMKTFSTKVHIDCIPKLIHDLQKMRDKHKFGFSLGINPSQRKDD